MSGKSQPPYSGPPKKQQRGNKTNAKTKPSAVVRKAARIERKKQGKL